MKKNSETIASNRKAHFNYEILDTYEAGIMLTGPEVKSLRAGHAQIAESYVAPEKGELFLVNSHIAEYKNGKSGFVEQNTTRPRKLLLHKGEINKLTGKIAEQGYTLMPLQVYFKGSLVKVEIGLAKGKKLYDKREDIAKRDLRRETEREFKVKNL